MAPSLLSCCVCVSVKVWDSYRIIHVVINLSMGYKLSSAYDAMIHLSGWTKAVQYADTTCKSYKSFQ